MSFHPRRLLYRALIPCALLLILAAHAMGADDELATILGRKTMEPERPLNEVRAFIAAHVARMPELRSAEQWQQLADPLRERVLNEVVLRGEAQRWKSEPLRVEWLDVIEGGADYRIRKLRYQALPGLWIPALLYEPLNLTGQVPVILNVNGHDGNGKAAVYKQMRCSNLAKRGCLALNVEWFGMGQLRHGDFAHSRMNQLDLCGTSGLAPFFLAMQRGLDVLLAHEHADPTRVAVAGLSGGGWQTIMISALDTRVTLCNPVAGYSSFLTRLDNFSDIGDSEQTPTDLGAMADYTHLTAMLAPRGALLTYNIKDDCCFASDHALPPLLEAARPIYAMYNASDKLLSHVNHDPGTHNFEKDNRLAFYRAIHALFFEGGEGFGADELSSEQDVKTAEQLNVPLPEKNAGFHTLAASLLPALPRAAEWPESREAFERWAASRREVLKSVVRYPAPVAAQATQTATVTMNNVQVTYWKLDLNGTWTLPVIELAPEGSTECVVVIADSGRQKATEQIAAHLAAKRRVVAVDLLLHGESAISQAASLFPMLVATVGHRPLGVQASQLISVSQWAAQRQGQGQGQVQTQKTQLHAVGPRMSVVALVASALQPDVIADTTLAGSLGSLKELIEHDRTVEYAPELFCLGLLEQFDLNQIAALSVPRRVAWTAPSERIRKELAPVERLYQLHEVDFSPLGSSTSDDAAATVNRAIEDIAACGAGAADADAPANTASSWWQFRGPQGQGRAAATDLPVEWGPETSVAWRAEVPGEGWSSPVVHKECIYVTSAVKDSDTTIALRALCLDADKGTVLWSRDVFAQDVATSPMIHSKNSHASPTPLIVEDRLYVHFGHQGTACLDLDGKVLWTNRTLKYEPVHGNGGSPCVWNDLLIFSCDGGSEPFIAALDRATGQVRWRVARNAQTDKKFSFSTPLVIEAAGTTQLISPCSGAVISYDPATGREIWRVRYDGYSVIPRPVFGHGLVYVCTGYNTPNLLAIRPDGQGDVTDTHVQWKAVRGVPHTPSPLLVDDELYMVADNGVVSCLDAHTGKVHWRERADGNFSASPIFADGKIFLQSEEGLGYVLAAGTTYHLLASNDLGERTLASYAVLDRALFIRSASHLYRIQRR